MTDRSHEADIGLGCVKLGSVSAGGPRAGVRLVHAAVDRGVHFFDTADAYGAGASERVLGRALRGRRERVVVATKVGYLFDERSAAELLARQLAAPVLARLGRGGGGGAVPAAGPGVRGAYENRNYTPAHLRNAVEGSLRRLHTDRIDLYQLHGPPSRCPDDTIAALEQLRVEGKILTWGAGLEVLDGAERWLDTPGFASVQLPFGVLDPEAGDALIPAARERGVAVVARGVFAAGLLADIDAAAEQALRPPQRDLRRALRAAAAEHGVHPLALAASFVRHRPGVGTVLLGMSSLTHLEENLRHMRTGPLAPELDAAVGAALTAYRAATATAPSATSFGAAPSDAASSASGGAA